MSKFKFIYLFVFSLIIPSWSIGQNIDVSIYNRTGYDLDSVSFENFYLGNLKKDSTFLLIGIGEITMQGDLPLHRPFGKIEGENKPFNSKPCSTKAQKKKLGSFAFDLMIYESENKYRLYWKKHEE